MTESQSQAIDVDLAGIKKGGKKNQRAKELVKSRGRDEKEAKKRKKRKSDVKNCSTSKKWLLPRATRHPQLSLKLPLLPLLPRTKVARIFTAWCVAGVPV